ncbi:MAG: protease inhibitor I42 family protein [Dehalococcoidia bacterium]
MKPSNFYLYPVLPAIVALLCMIFVGCTLLKPATPPVPASHTAPAASIPSANVTPATPATPEASSTPPAAEQPAPPSSYTLPVISYFSASSTTIPPNGISILVWSVSGADSLSIDNGIGKVDAQGRHSVLPVASTTYTLTATSSAGSVTAQVTVSISPHQAASPQYSPGYYLTRIGQTAVAGSPLTINQNAETSKGYKWVVDYYDPTILSYVGSNTIMLNAIARGVDSQQQFTFQPLHKGDTVILVSYVNDKTPTQFDSTIYNIHIQ